MIRRLAHACLMVPDLDATERFFVDALGLSLGFEFRRGDDRVGFYLACGETTFLEVFRTDARKPGNVDHVCLEVDDLDAVIAKAEAAGHPLTQPKKLGADHSWQAWLEAPGGVKVELHQYTEASLQVVGGVCEVGW